MDAVFYDPEERAKQRAASREQDEMERPKRHLEEETNRLVDDFLASAIADDLVLPSGRPVFSSGILPGETIMEWPPGHMQPVDSIAALGAALVASYRYDMRRGKGWR